MSSITLAQSEQLKETGLQLFRQGDTDAALRSFEEAVSAFEAEGNIVGIGEMLNNIGVAQGRAKNWDEALQAVNRALELFRRSEDLNREGQTLANMGDIYAGMKQKEEAALAYQTASDLLAQSGDKAKQSQVLRALSLHHIRQRHWTLAMATMEKSISARPRPGISGRLFRTLLRFALQLTGYQI